MSIAARADAKLPGEVDALTDEVRSTVQRHLEVIGKASDEPKPKADAEKARRAILVLGPVVYPVVDNALRHGGGTVRIGVDRGESAVEIVVRDEGAGFPAAFLPRAFERFARADDARGGGGAGLGLAIVDAIAASRVMVLVLSEHSNRSRQVVREVQRAVAGQVDRRQQMRAVATLRVSKSCACHGQSPVPARIALLPAGSGVPSRPQSRA